MKSSLVLIIIFSQSALAQSLLRQRCEQAVNAYDTEQARSRDEIKKANELASKYKAEFNRKLATEQKLVAEKFLKAYLKTPEIQEYLQTIKTSPQFSSMAKDLLRTSDFAKNLQSSAQQFGLSLMGHDSLDHQAIVKSSDGEMAVRISTTSYLRDVDGRLHLIIVNSGHSEPSLPRYGSMSTGMTIIDLENNREVTTPVQIPSWGGPRQKKILGEPFSDWQDFVKHLNDSEPQGIRDCRDLLSGGVRPAAPNGHRQ